MNRVMSVYELTKSMISLLEQYKVTKKDRDQTMKEMDALIQQRDQHIAHFKEPYTEEEMAIGKKIIQMNERLELEMGRLFAEIKSDMKKVKQNKELNYSYIKPYGNIKTTDGMYVDDKL